MASDIATTTIITLEDSQRKHSRSPDNEPDGSPKRHKHRHRHHHRSRHHRHRSRKHDGDSKHGDDAVLEHNLNPDNDVEEGEIVDDIEEVIGDDDDEFEKKDADTKNLGECKSNGDFVSGEIIHKKEKRANQFGISSIKEDVSDSRNTNAEHYEIVVNDDFPREYHRKGNVAKQTVSNDSDDGMVRSRSRSRLRDTVRNKHRSPSAVKEVSQWDGEREIDQSRDHSRGRNHSRDDKKGCHISSNRHYKRPGKDQSPEIYGEDMERRDRIREKERDRSMGNSKRMERERGMSRDRERGQERRVRENERERSSDWVKERKSRDREKERERSRDRYSDRERIRERDLRMSTDSEMDSYRRREKEQDRSKDRGIDKDRWKSERDRSRDRVKESECDKERERDRDWTREREKESSQDKNRDKGKDKASYMDYRYDEDRRDRRSRCDIEKYNNSQMDPSKEGEEKSIRDEEEDDDYFEKISLQLASQEEEDIDRIKEESRRRREAILEKYKAQQIQQQGQLYLNGEVKEERIVEETDEQTSIAVPEYDARHDGADVYDAEPSFSVGKSPTQNGLSAFERSFGTGGLGEGTPKSERSNDMFCDDIFGDSPAGDRKLAKANGLAIEKNGLHDNWDDAEGYYSYRFGENLDGRYEITAAHGKGVFSNVVRAKDVKAGNGEPEEVAIKIIRNNETMYKAGQSELVILKKLVGADPENKRHCVRFLSSFKYRNHLCLVFESLHMNLREVLKKFGRNIGLKLTAVRAYAKQLFIALKHLRNCGVLHCDIKPDNMLVNEAKNVLKLCDFGSAMFAGKNEITPYLVSRFYRSPEIILGLPYDHPMDIWSVGCCLYELYTGKVLFPGPSNNDMLRLHMELKGSFPKKMLRKGGFIDQHFDHDLNFLAMEEDPVTKKPLRRMVTNIKPKDIGTIITGSPGEDPKMLVNFKDLLDKIFMLDPEKRMTVSQALNHPFITGK